MTDFTVALIASFSTLAKTKSCKKWGKCETFLLRIKLFTGEFMGSNLQITNYVYLVYLRQDQGILNGYSLQTITMFSSLKLSPKRSYIMCPLCSQSMLTGPEPHGIMNIREYCITSFKTTCSLRYFRWCWGWGTLGSSVRRNKISLAFLIIKD